MEHLGDASNVSLRLEPRIEGPETGETLVFIQGWPDDASLWDRHVAALKDRYRCVRLTMPNFDGRRTVRWGYRTDEIVEALAALVREVSPDARVTLILHDWGCFWGHRVHHRYPELVSRVAGIDVAPHVEPGAGAIFGIIAYQWWLIAAFAIGGPIGDGMTRWLAKAIGAPLSREQIHSWMNYPYLNAWRELFAGAGDELKSYWPTCPLLFVYGKEKPFPFHSGAWERHVEENGGRHVGLDCGHWVPVDPGFLPVLAEWLEATGGAVAGDRAPAATGAVNV